MNERVTELGKPWSLPFCEVKPGKSICVNGEIYIKVNPGSPIAKQLDPELIYGVSCLDGHIRAIAPEAEVELRQCLWSPIYG